MCPYQEICQSLARKRSPKIFQAVQKSDRAIILSEKWRIKASKLKNSNSEND
jgi:hypothetical protein